MCIYSLGQMSIKVNIFVLRMSELLLSLGSRDPMLLQLLARLKLSSGLMGGISFKLKPNSLKVGPWGKCLLDKKRGLNMLLRTIQLVPKSKSMEDSSLLALQFKERNYLKKKALSLPSLKKIWLTLSGPRDLIQVLLIFLFIKNGQANPSFKRWTGFEKR